MICPICRQCRASARYRPFCSRRCADEDLSRWLDGTYAVPADPAGEDAAPPGPPRGPERRD